MGKEGFEPSRLATHDPKSCLSANSSTSPKRTNYMSLKNIRQHNYGFYRNKRPWIQLTSATKLVGKR